MGGALTPGAVWQVGVWADAALVVAVTALRCQAALPRSSTGSCTCRVRSHLTCSHGSCRSTLTITRLLPCLPAPPRMQGTSASHTCPADCVSQGEMSDSSASHCHTAHPLWPHSVPRHPTPCHHLSPHARMHAGCRRTARLPCWPFPQGAIRVIPPHATVPRPPFF